MRQNYERISDDWLLARLLHKEEELISYCAFKDVNLTAETDMALKHRYENCLFLGCTLPDGFGQRTVNCTVFPHIEGNTFDPFRSRLYTAETLYEGYRRGDPDSYARCYDAVVYRQYLSEGKQPGNLKVTLLRALHDYSISENLHRMLTHYDPISLVGVMGGHGILRTDDQYEQVARISKQLTEQGCIMISGGGPGAMEATHLGAWMAGRTEEEFAEALALMQTAPCFKDRLWLDTAMQVHDRFPQRDYISIGIPTWLYGHEPATPLATCIAKYFDNSIREDGILTLAAGGIIFTPGSAGTLQEIFQEAVQNHYLSFGFASPMCFLGRDFWTREVPIYPFIEKMLERGRYMNLLLSLTDSTEEVVQTILDFRHKFKPETNP